MTLTGLDSLIVTQGPWLNDLMPGAVSAMDRLRALTNVSTTERPVVIQPYLNIGLGILLVLMVALLIRSTYNRVRQNRRKAEQAFYDAVRRCSLSVHEYSLLTDMIKHLKCRLKDQIFRDPDLFERGANRLLERAATTQGPEAHQRLVAELSFMREKMGYRGTASLDQTPLAKARRRLSTREIPAGKQLFVTRRLGQTTDHIEATVLANEEEQLVLTLAKPIKVTFGEVWRARYYFGASVWEFDTSLVSYDGDRLILKHSTDVRFVNRRRFARVPVRNMAFVCPFPFSRLACAPRGSENEAWRPLEFVPALVTELAGPGLRVDVDLDVQTGDRVLVVFRIDPASPRPHSASPTVRIIEDVAVVRRVDRTHTGRSIAVELTALRESDLDELVQATNRAALDQGQTATEPDNRIEDDARVETLVRRET